MPGWAAAVTQLGLATPAIARRKSFPTMTAQQLFTTGEEYTPPQWAAKLRLVRTPAG